MLYAGPEVQAGDGPVSYLGLSSVDVAGKVMLVDQGQGMHRELPDCIRKVWGLV